MRRTHQRVPSRSLNQREPQPATREAWSNAPPSRPDRYATSQKPAGTRFHPTDEIPAPSGIDRSPLRTAGANIFQLVVTPDFSPLGPGLVVEYLDRTYRPETELMFGRSAEVELDADNPYLHRLAGRFVRRSDGWWIENLGEVLPLRLNTSAGMMIELTSGTEARLPGRLATLRVTAGPTTYELAYFHPLAGLGMEVPSAPDGLSTLLYGAQITGRQRDFLVTLGEQRLKGRVAPLPTQREVAKLWGVSKATVDKTLENLRSRLRASGVRFIDSPEMLVEHAVINRLITLDDLAWAALDDPAGPRNAASRSPNASDSG